MNTPGIDPVAEPIVGSWKLTDYLLKGTTYEESESGKTSLNYDTKTLKSTKIFTFKADGTFVTSGKLVIKLIPTGLDRVLNGKQTIPLFEDGGKWWREGKVFKILGEHSKNVLILTLEKLTPNKMKIAQYDFVPEIAHDKRQSNTHIHYRKFIFSRQ